MRAAIHGTMVHCVCWLFQHSFNHEGWNNWHSEHEACPGFFNNLSSMRAGTRGTAGTRNMMRSITMAGVHGAAGTVA